MIALLIASHSPLVAEGIAQVAAAMSGNPAGIVGVGGNEEGELGNSLSLILGKLNELLGEYDGVVIIPDIGSAVLTSVAALEMLSDEERARVAIADAPILEGAVLAAVEAAGSSLDEVVKSAQEAYHIRKID